MSGRSSRLSLAGGKKFLEGGGLLGDKLREILAQIEFHICQETICAIRNARE